MEVREEKRYPWESRVMKYDVSNPFIIDMKPFPVHPILTIMK